MTSIVDSKFYSAFGALMYSYATVEVGIKHCISAMMNIDTHRGLIAFSPYTAANVANIAKSVADEFLKEPWKDQLTTLVSRWQKHTDLRTYIAHHRWRPGTRVGAIRPTFWDVRSGKLRIKGFNPDERDYTVEEIMTAALDLATINEDIKDFLKKSGLWDIIEPKAEETGGSSE